MRLALVPRYAARWIAVLVAAATAIARARCAHLPLEA